MCDFSGEIIHVSDTALMTAACRALEIPRAGCLVNDPFAERLAGERGMAIVRSLPNPEIMCFGVGLRSRYLDDLVVDAISRHGIRTAVILGAGLDTRPWRLDLPAELRWLEVDFPDVLDYKSGLLAGETPHCRLERMAADLTVAEQRQAIYAAVGAEPALMITEGLLMYLPGEAVVGIAVEPPMHCGVRHWLADISSKQFSERVQMGTYRGIQNVRAAGSLNGDEVLETMRSHGWQSIAWRNYTTDAIATAAIRIRDMVASGAVKPPEKPMPPDDPSGVHLFAKS